MKKIIIILFIFATSIIIAQTNKFRTIKNKAFTVGEKLTFSINYGFVTAGAAVMQVSKLTKISKREVYKIDFKVNSTRAFDLFYKVRDRYVTYLDTAGLFPWRFEQHIREGSYSRDFSAFFNQRNGKVRTSKGAYHVDTKYFHDIISAFYFVRTINFEKRKPGEIIHLKNFYKTKIYPLDIVYRGKETIEVEAGTFNCIVLEPLIKKGGLFKSEGNIFVWLTDDDVKMPVKVKAKIIIGSINADLVKYEGLRSKLYSKIKN